MEEPCQLIPKTVNNYDNSLINLLYQSGISVQQMGKELNQTSSQIHQVLIDSGWTLNCDDDKNPSVSAVVTTKGNLHPLNLPNLSVADITVKESSRPLSACLENEIRDIRPHLASLMMLELPQIKISPDSQVTQLPIDRGSSMIDNLNRSLIKSSDSSRSMVKIEVGIRVGQSWAELGRVGHFLKILGLRFSTNSKIQCYKYGNHLIH